MYMNTPHFIACKPLLGSSIYDVHTEGVRLRWTHVDGGGSQAPCGRPYWKLKIEFADVILSSSHAKGSSIYDVHKKSGF